MTASTDPPIFQSPKDVVRAMAAAVPEITVSSTVAIVGAKAPIVRQIGSGTLVVVADSYFVLTAAHVVREGQRRGYTLGASGENQANFTALAGNWIVSDEKHDVAVYQLGMEQVTRLGNVKFVRIADASFLDDLSNGYFVVTGFPGMWSTAIDQTEEAMTSKLLQYGTWSFTGSTSALGGYDPAHHFLLSANPSEGLDLDGTSVTFRTRQGFPAQMPADLRGISGCSVWMIGDITKPVEKWSKGTSRIIGIETGVFQSRGAIKATRWNAVTTLLYNAFPATRSAIEMYAHGTWSGEI